MKIKLIFEREEDSDEDPYGKFVILSKSFMTPHFYQYIDVYRPYKYGIAETANGEIIHV